MSGLSVTVALLWRGWIVQGQEATRAASRAQAVAAAQAEGKLVLAEFGMPGQQASRQVEDLLAQDARVRRTLLSSFVLWTNDVSQSSGLAAYMACLPDASQSGVLPLLCVLDPRGTNEIYRWYAGFQLGARLYVELAEQARLHSPLVIQNLPAAPLKNRSFTLTGTATTSARAAGAIAGVPIRSVLFRLQGKDWAWASAKGTKKWRAELTLEPGTNSVETCVLYGDGQKSWTNRVPLVYQPPGPGHL